MIFSVSLQKQENIQPLKEAYMRRLSEYMEILKKGLS